MKTIEDPVGRCSLAAAPIRKCARRLTFATRSHSSTLVPVSPTPGADADVQHDAVHPAERGGGIRDERPARVGVTYVGRDHRRLGAFRLDQRRCHGCGLLVGVDARDRCTFAGGEHRDGTAVADGLFGVVGDAGPGADHDDLAAVETSAHAGNPSTPSSRCTRIEFSAIETKWYWPTLKINSISCALV